MAVDSRDKRASILEYTLPLGGPLPNPDSTIDLSARVQLTYLYPADNVGELPVSLVVSGTALGATQEEIRAGGKTIILTIVNDTWTNPISGSAISGGFSGDGGSTGWEAVILAQLFNSYAGIVRTSDTVITITLPAVPSYSISANETITVVIPGSQRSDIESDDLSGGTFQILESANLGGIRGKGGKEYYPRWIIVGGRRYWVANAYEERLILEAYLREKQAEVRQAELDEEPQRKRKAKIAVTKTAKRLERVSARSEVDEWLEKLRQEDEEILSLLH